MKKNSLPSNLTILTELFSIEAFYSRKFNAEQFLFSWDNTYGHLPFMGKRGEESDEQRVSEREREKDRERREIEREDKIGREGDRERRER